LEAKSVEVKISFIFWQIGRSEDYFIFGRPLGAGLGAGTCPSKQKARVPRALRLGAIWILAYADDLAVICASTVRLSRCLSGLSRTLSKFWLKISLIKTEVVHFMSRPNPRRPILPVRICGTQLPQAQSFKYSEVVIQANGSLALHQQAVGVKSRVAAREVAKLFKALEINDLFRL
jgi:hypothetical protein